MNNTSSVCHIIIIIPFFLTLFLPYFSELKIEF
jgi:hypothetical protein